MAKMSAKALSRSRIPRLNFAMQSIRCCKGNASRPTLDNSDILALISGLGRSEHAQSDQGIASMSIDRIQGYCGLCIARCGSVAVVEDGRFVALEPDPTHPTGQALCAKGRAAPELVYHADRLTHPLKR